MMNRNTFLILLTVLIISCNPSVEKEIEVIDNLKSDYNKFYNAQRIADIDDMFSYFHQIQIDIFKEKQTGITESELKTMFSEHYSIYSSKESMNIIEISDTISFKNNILSIIKCNYSGFDLDEKFDFDIERIAISKNKGISWKFIKIEEAFFEYTKTKLTKELPANKVDLLLSYSEVNNIISNRDTTEYIPQNIIEKNLLTQIAEYNNALYTGDVDLLHSYFHPDVFTAMRNRLPNGDEYTIEEIKELNKTELVDVLSEKFKQYEIKMYITDKINDIIIGKKLVYVMSGLVVLSNGSNDFRVEGQLIAISENNGTTWKFIDNKNENGAEVLKLSFSEENIKKILNTK